MKAEIYPNFPVQMSGLLLSHIEWLSSECDISRHVQGVLVSEEPKLKLTEKLPSTDKLSPLKLHVAFSPIWSFSLHVFSAPLPWAGSTLSPREYLLEISKIFKKVYSLRIPWYSEVLSYSPRSSLFGGAYVGTHLNLEPLMNCLPFSIHYPALLLDCRSLHHVRVKLWPSHKWVRVWYFWILCLVGPILSLSLCLPHRFYNPLLQVTSGWFAAPNTCFQGWG